MLIVGGIIGFVLGAMICLVVASVLGVALALFGPLATLLAPLLTPLVALLGAIAPNSVLLLGFLAVFTVTGLHYALGAVSLLRPMATTPAGPLPPSIPELFARGVIIGLTASINFAIWTVMLHNPVIGSIFALIGLLATVPPVSRSFGYQVVLGWTSWLLPMSYLIMPLGILLFLLNIVVTLIATGAFPRLRLDASTGTFETDGGTVVAFLFGITTVPGVTFGGFNLGNFTFINFPATAPTPFVPGPAGGVSSHETGHTLTIGAFGGFFGWINAFDEVVLARLTRAYGEVIPESHFPRAALQDVREWS